MKVDKDPTLQQKNGKNTRDVVFCKTLQRLAILIMTGTTASNISKNRLKNTKSIRGYLKAPFDHNSPVFELILKQFEPRLELDHALPETLKLLPIEEEVFYLIHFACYAMGKKCKEEIIKQSDSLALNSILKIDTREETAAALKEMICDKVNCTIQNDPNWMNCSNEDTNLIYQKWCKKYPNLSNCLNSETS